jgi:ssDNA-binding Zn-finger/Zn-ribbon topoisomerase 1
MNPLIIFKLKCPVCGHTERKAAMEIPTDGPVCPKCYGPMIPEKVETRA